MPRICSCPTTHDIPLWGFSNYPHLLRGSILSEVVSTSIFKGSARLVLAAPTLTRNEFGACVVMAPTIAIILMSLFYRCRDWIVSDQFRVTINVLSLSSAAKSDPRQAPGLLEFTGPRPDCPDRYKRPLSCLLGVYELV